MYLSEDTIKDYEARVNSWPTMLKDLAIAACFPVAVLVVAWVSLVDAQTVLQVPYDKAAFRWDAPHDPPPAGVGVTRWYVVNCGGPDVRVDVPATSIPVKDVVSTPGSYTCTLKAMNTFGASVPATFPAFEAGYVPATAENVRIEIAP